MHPLHVAEAARRGADPGAGGDQSARRQHRQRLPRGVEQRPRHHPRPPVGVAVAADFTIAMIPLR